MARFVHLQDHVGTPTQLELVIDADEIAAITKNANNSYISIFLKNQDDPYELASYTLLELLSILGIQPAAQL